MGLAIPNLFMYINRYFKIHEKVQVNEVREKLAKYLSEAEQGEEIIILRHSKPIARLFAYKEGKPKFPGYDKIPKAVQG